MRSVADRKLRFGIGQFEAVIVSAGVWLFTSGPPAGREGFWAALSTAGAERRAPAASLEASRSANGVPIRQPRRRPLYLTSAKIFAVSRPPLLSSPQEGTDAVGGVSVLPGSVDPETVDPSIGWRLRTAPAPQTRKTPNKRWDARPSFFPTSRISCWTKGFWGVDAVSLLF